MSNTFCMSPFASIFLMLKSKHVNLQICPPSFQRLIMFKYDNVNLKHLYHYITMIICPPLFQCMMLKSYNVNLKHLYQCPSLLISPPSFKCLNDVKVQ